MPLGRKWAREFEVGQIVNLVVGFRYTPFLRNFQSGTLIERNYDKLGYAIPVIVLNRPKITLGFQANCPGTPMRE
jgi:hypothetical protein